MKGFEKYSNRERWAARHIDALVCMTEAVRAHCRAARRAGSTTQVVYDALDEAEFAPQRDAAAVRAELGIANGSPCVGVVGNIQEWKGQAVLVEAMARIVDRVPKAHAFIVGGVHRAGAAYNERLKQRIQELHLDSALSVDRFSQRCCRRHERLGRGRAHLACGPSRSAA